MAVMETNFEEIIATFLESRIGISNNFLPIELANNLKQNLGSLYKEEALKIAGIGNGNGFSVNKQVRTDKIFWLNRNELRNAEQLFFDLIDSFVIYLNRSCFTGIKSYEFHYALFEEGAFYRKHIDQFNSDDGRAFSMIMYLNEGWVKEDKGELKVYVGTEVQLVSPDNQKCVFFKSNELAHEVLVTNKPRMSITGWLKTS
jgi:SM-20-related protein